MFSYVGELFQLYPTIGWSIVAALAAGLVIMHMWDAMKFWWMNTWYAFPAIGKLSRLSKDGNRADNTGWFNSERTLCSDYGSFIQIMSRQSFQEKIAYLKKAGDNGRKATPALIWALTVVLVLIEAKGFSYVLAGYAIPGASEATQLMAADGLALMLSVVCVGFTHLAGHELYKTSKIKHARSIWNQGGQEHELQAGTVALADLQSIDDHMPVYTQMANRVGTKPTYIVTVVTAIFVVAVAIGATYVRGQVLESQSSKIMRTQIEEITQPQKGGSLDMRAVPDADRDSGRDAELVAMKTENGHDLKGAWVTFIILAVLFVFLQGLSVLFGYRWGFAGENSYEAYKALRRGRYTTYDDVRADIKRITAKATQQMLNLHQRMKAHHSAGGAAAGFNPIGSFGDYLREEMEREEEERFRSDSALTLRASQPAAGGANPGVGGVTTVTLPNPTHLAAPALGSDDKRQAPTSNVTPLTPASAGIPAGLSASAIAAMTQLDMFGDNKAAKSTYLKSLPETVFAEVRVALAAKKAEAEKSRNQQRDNEIEGLL